MSRRHFERSRRRHRGNTGNEFAADHSPPYVLALLGLYFRDVGLVGHGDVHSYIFYDPIRPDSPNFQPDLTSSR